MYNILFWFSIIIPVLSVDDYDFDQTTVTPTISFISDHLPTHHESHSNLVCSIDFAQYILSVNNKDWATQMYDSMEETQYGTMYGRFVFMGNFDECISAIAEDFKGKHCMVDVIYGSRQPRLGNHLSYGFCVPSTCSGGDIESAIGKFISHDHNVTIRASDKNCWTSDPVVLSVEDWIIIVFLGVIGLIVVSSTVLDITHRNNVLATDQYEFYSSFSLYRNCKQLITLNDGPESIGCLRGIRSLTMCWVILNHEYMLASLMPVMNAAVVFRDFLHNKYEVPIINGFLVVDTFLLLSGLLVTIVFFRCIEKSGNFDVPAVVIRRFVRVTPAFAAVVLIQSTILIKIGRGPMWNKVMVPIVNSCRERWWTGLIYLENILTPKIRCLVPSWYLSIDMQMFWLAPLLLYPILLWPKKGLVLLFIGLVAALITNFVVSHSYELGPHRIFTKSPRQLEVDYIQTHMRLTPYIIGMGLGYLLCGIKGKKIVVNLAKKWIVIGWLTSAGICLGSMYGIIYFINNEYDDDVVGSSFYLTFHRLGWSLGIAWVIFACTVGYGGPVDRILSWNGFQIFSNLSYSMFLVHTPIQICKNAMTKTNFYLHDLFLVSNFFSTLVFSILLSIVLYLSIEAPFINIYKYFFRNLKILPYPKSSGNLSDNPPKSTVPQLISIELKNGEIC